MYLQIGGSAAVREKEIVGIFDIDNCSTGQRTRRFFDLNQKKGVLVETTDELPKSFVVTAASGVSKIYISGVSPATIRKRAAEAGD